jgi:hypothetical protein
VKGLLALFVLLAGCKPDESKASDIASKAASWAATAGVVRAAMNENRAPATFGKNTLNDAQKELAAWQKQAPAFALSDSARARLQQALDAEADSLRRLRADLSRRKQ